MSRRCLREVAEPYSYRSAATHTSLTEDQILLLSSWRCLYSRPRPMLWLSTRYLLGQPLLSAQQVMHTADFATTLWALLSLRVPFPITVSVIESYILQGRLPYDLLYDLMPWPSICPLCLSLQGVATVATTILLSEYPTPIWCRCRLPAGYSLSCLACVREALWPTRCGTSDTEVPHLWALRDVDMCIYTILP